MSDAFSPVFDLNGKYLYFLESTNDGPSYAGIDLSSLDRAQTTAPHVVVLAKDGASRVRPESDPQSVLNDVDSFAASTDGVKVLYSRKAAWTIAPADDLKPGNGNPGKPLNMSQMQATVDRRAEWRQMYHETWRLERDFLYAPDTHGLSIPKIEARYKQYLDNMA